MLEKVFLQVLNMSLTASVVILFVLAARLLLKKAPKIFSYALWGIVLFRLVCPFSFESVLSLLPTKPAPIPTDIAYSAPPRVDTGIPAVDQAVDAALPPAAPEESVNPMQVLVFAGSLVWLAGIAGLLGYNCVRLERLRRRLKNAVCEEGNIYRAEGLESPFVMGLFRPKIYLPAGLDGEERQYILLHERTHIRRGDPVIKFAGFLVLCLHWFNPLVWAVFFLFGRDMEMSCDESVVRRLGSGAKKAYSSTLLALATGKRIVGGTPLAFGEGDARGRIKNVLNYRKPAFWALLLILLAVAALTVGLALNPREKETALAPEELAGRFAEVWQAKWETIEAHDTMLLGEGKAFLADITGDSRPELFFLYDNFKLSRAVAYEISGGDIRELGEFDASSFYNNVDLRFTFYQKGNGRMLRTDSTFYGPAADPRNTVTDVFVTLQNGKMSRVEPAPCRVVTADGAVEEYRSSDRDGVPITREEYDQRIAEILGGYEEAETIVLERGAPPFSFLNGEALRDTIRAFAEAGNAGAPGVRTENGAAGTASTLEEIEAAAKRFTTGETDPLEVGKTAFTHYYGAFSGEAVPQDWRIGDFLLQRLELTAGDQEEFCVIGVVSYTTDGEYFLVGAGKPYGDGRPGGFCRNVQREMRVQRTGSGGYRIVSIGTGGGAQGLTPVDPPRRYPLDEGSPYSLLLLEDGYQLSISRTADFQEIPLLNEGFAFWNMKTDQLHVSLITGIGHPKSGEVEGPIGSLAGASVQFDMDIKTGKILDSEFEPGASPEQLTLSISEERLSGIGQALKQVIDELRSTSNVSVPSEGNFLRAVVGSAEIEGGKIRLSIPPVFPASGNEFSLEVYGFYEDEPGSHARLDFFREIEDAKAWEAGKTYEETLDEPLPEGTEVSFFASFVKPETPETGIQTDFRLRRLVWENGAAREEVLPGDTVISPRLTPSASGTEAELIYTESDGGTFRAKLTLLAGWTLRPPETGKDGIFFAEMGIYNGEKQIGYVGYDIFEFHPEAGDEHFNVSVYGSLMMGSVVGWDNEYRVISGKEREASTAICEVYHAPNGAGGGTYTHKGILSHDTGLERFIAIEFTDDSVTEEEWLSIAKSIRLSQ